MRLQNKSLRILQVTRQYPPSIGGIERAVESLSTALVARGHQVEVVALNRTWEEPAKPLQSSEKVNGLTIRRIKYIGNQRYAIAPDVLKHIENIDIIHIHSSDFFLDFLALLKPLHRKPLVITSHGFYFHTPFASWFKQFYFQTVTRTAFRNIDALICVSAQDLNRVKNLVSAHKLVLIPNGLNLPVLESIDHDPKRIICVGRLAENKQIDQLLSAFAWLLKDEPQAKLDIVGKDSGEGQKLKEMVEQWGISKNVHFHGEVDNTKLASLLSNAGIWASASRYEGFGIGLLEGMAAGCIPVVTKIDAFCELVQDGKNGLIANFSEPANASAKLLAAMNLQESIRNGIRLANQERSKDFQWSKIAQRVEEVYLQVLAKNK